MTREDTDRLFELLRLFRPGDPKVDNKRLRSAWALVLEPYEVDDVRSAVADYFRGNSFFPDVTDIATRCQRQPEPKRAEQEISEDVTHDLHWEQQKLWVEWHMLWKQSLVEFGLETIPDEVWDEFPGKLITPQEWAGQKAGV